MGNFRPMILEVFETVLTIVPNSVGEEIATAAMTYAVQSGKLFDYHIKRIQSKKL